ncbi:hypothetical protein [Phyllobacterium zundukense]|uniref:Uncharacterized protein n=1 Tax=Phyllobacterium zundukense TaxID=1867719 RepID=A0ACD4CXH3_9HYPH|nr:hypothetical protein [Phyllobacterium zundukense]UXN58290.1 hypothetical protein N8E88_05645 [Phyllobacterium zundukense]
MFQPINNVGSQQALENNWNDENAMRKFERATEGASRQRKDEIQANKQRPTSVELRASSKSVEQKNAPGDQDASRASFEASVANKRDKDAQTGQAANVKASNRATRHYLAGGLCLVILIVVIGYPYFI